MFDTQGHEGQLGIKKIQDLLLDSDGAKNLSKPLITHY
jgi:hypothetical protein